MKSFRKPVIGALAVLVGGIALSGGTASAQDCYLGEVRMFAGNFSPRGWAAAEGQLLPISQNTALFSLLGTTYGGDGRTTFALPDLRGRAPVGVGQGPGLSNRPLGSKFGQETVIPNSVNIETSPGSDPVVIGATPMPVAQPSLAIGYHICMQGLYPSRS